MRPWVPYLRLQVSVVSLVKQRTDFMELVKGLTQAHKATITDPIGGSGEMAIVIVYHLWGPLTTSLGYR